MKYIILIAFMAIELSAQAATYTYDFSVADFTLLHNTPQFDLTTGSIEIRGGQATPNQGSGAFSACYYTTAVTDDQETQIYLTNLVAGFYGGVWFRGEVGSVNGYCFVATTTSCKFSKFVSGVESILATGSGYANGDIIGIVAVGNQIRFYKNGSLNTSINSTGIVTDNTFSSGRIGVATFGSADSYTMDNWSGGDYVAPPAVHRKKRILNELVWYTQYFDPAWAAEEPPPPGETRIAPFLSHNQLMLTYAGASNNDFVGTWDPWYPSKDTTSGTFSYSLINDISGTYAINSSTGIITIANNSGLAARTDEVIVQTSLQDRTEIDTAFVRVVATANSHFTDPSVGSDGTGSRASPWKTLNGKTQQAGHAYFLARGTTYTDLMNAGYSACIIVSVAGTSGSEIMFGAYGTGNRPILNPGVANYGFSIVADFNQIYELKFTNARNGILKRNTGVWHDHTTLSDLEFDDAGNVNGQIFWQPIANAFDYPTFDRMYDIYSHNGDEYGIKIENGHVTMRNVKTIDNVRYGVSLATCANHTEVSGLVSRGNDEYCIEMSGPHNHLEYSILDATNGYNAIEFDDFSSGKSRVNNCLIYGPCTYRPLIDLRTGEAADDDFSAPNAGNRTGFIFEEIEFHNTLSGTAAIAIRHRTDSVIVRRCIFHNCTYGIQVNQTITATYGTEFSYNICYSNSTSDIQGTAGNNVKVYNNICDGSIDLSGTTAETVRGNLYRTLTSAATASNNLDLDGIVTADYFLNYAGKNFHLKSTASGAIDQGYDWGQTGDYDKHLMTGSQWDIGPFEYIP